MRLVVGLGNPGAQYNFTRHNFGFLALDFYFKTHGLEWEPHPKLGAVWRKAGDVIFIKPQDFYNNSGKAVQAFAHFYKIPTTEILVLADDFNLDFGVLRYRERGSAGGNNGLKSTIAELGTEDFPRLRLGSGNAAERRKVGDVDFVLGKFLPEEKERLPQVLKTIAERLDEILED